MVSGAHASARRAAATGVAKSWLETRGLPSTLPPVAAGPVGDVTAPACESSRMGANNGNAHVERTPIRDIISNGNAHVEWGPTQECAGSIDLTQRDEWTTKRQMNMGMGRKDAHARMKYRKDAQTGIHTSKGPHTSVGTELATAAAAAAAARRRCVNSDHPINGGRHDHEVRRRSARVRNRRRCTWHRRRRHRPAVYLSRNHKIRNCDTRLHEFCTAHRPTRRCGFCRREFARREEAAVGGGQGRAWQQIQGRSARTSGMGQLRTRTRKPPDGEEKIKSQHSNPNHIKTHHSKSNHITTK